jgi:hypothetical protein
MILLSHVANCLRVHAVARSKKVCSALQNSPVVLGGCKFQMNIRGRGLLGEDPPGWDGISKVWMFWVLSTVPLMSRPRVKPYVRSQTYDYSRLPVRLTIGKGKYGSFVGKRSKKSYPGIGLERGWVDRSRWEMKNSNMSGFSLGNETLVTWLGYGRVWKTYNVTRLRLGYEKLITWPGHSRVVLSFSSKPKSHDFIVQCGKLPYPGF